MNHDLDSTIAFEAQRQVLAFKSYDLKEGVTAFVEKRKPKFKGK
jgi:enoyl-CoA hydratase/carnithine racemase